MFDLLYAIHNFVNQFKMAKNKIVNLKPIMKCGMILLLAAYEEFEEQEMED